MENNNEFIRKISFKYTKKDGEESRRDIIAPKFLKESFNSFKELDKDSVNYVSGYEINVENLSEEDVKEYEECICDYFNVAIPTMEEYLRDLGLDSKNIKIKSFKKSRISNTNILRG